jgi:hypothetical protein
MDLCPILFFINELKEFVMRKFIEFVFYATAIVMTYLSGSGIQAAETYTYRDLVKRLTDVELLAVLPQPDERVAMASSYDRASRFDSDTNSYFHWDANADGDGCVRKEGDLIVMADIQGPGCIWRIWSAAPSEGHVKIYLDGEEIPTIDMPFYAYFNRTIQNSPFTRPNLVYIAGEETEKTPNVPGCNNYTPIPFQKSCKIVAEPKWGAYYHFNYTQFPEGTRVPTFSMKLSTEDAAALDEADRILGCCGTNPAPVKAGQKVESNHLTVPAGQSMTVAEISGTQAITMLKVKTDLPKDAGQQRILLRQLMVQITWDNEQTPAVLAPLV